MARAERGRRIAAAVAIAAGVGALATLAVLHSAAPPEGPVAVDWDATRCARCGMLVSNPAFAAQLHLEDGSVRHYDDPGCLLADLADPDTPPAHAAWVHHYREQRWIPLEEAAFVRVEHSPMGYGLAALAAGESPDAIDVEAATAVATRPRDGHPRHGRTAPP